MITVISNFEQEIPAPQSPKKEFECEKLRSHLIVEKQKMKEKDEKILTLEQLVENQNKRIHELEQMIHKQNENMKNLINFHRNSMKKHENSIVLLFNKLKIKEQSQLESRRLLEEKEREFNLILNSPRPNFTHNAFVQRFDVTCKVKMNYFFFFFF